MKNTALRLAGGLALLTALYHGYEGDRILGTLVIDPAEQTDFVWSTYQIGTMGWLAGGVLLLAAAGFRSQQARSWVVFTYAVLFGFPAVGAVVLGGGNPGLGGGALLCVTLLALYGRHAPSPGAPEPALPAAHG
ncbi:MAG: hypothetical protein AAF730_10875 [Bacteroidota bacterium]